MTLSSIASKLRALRDLADNPGATEAERLNAAEKYETILHKYHLDASELELREEGVAHVTVELDPRGNSFVTGQLMAMGIARFTKCRTWMSERAPTQPQRSPAQ